MLHKVYWANPDGSRDDAAEIVTVGHAGKDHRWVNPEGIYGTIGETRVVQSRAKTCLRVNPDGMKGGLDVAADDREDAGAVAVAARD